MHHLNSEFGGGEDDSLALVPNVLASACRFQPADYRARTTKTQQLSLLSRNSAWLEDAGTV